MTHGRPLAPRGLEGGLLSRYLRIMTTMAALWLHYGAGGRPFVPDMRPLWRHISASRRPHSAPIKETITCCPKSCEPSQRRWIRSRKRLNTAQARASAGADYGGLSASGGTDLASSAAFSMNSSRRTDRTNSSSRVILSQLPLLRVLHDEHAAREVRKMRVQLLDLLTREHLHHVVLMLAS